MTSEGVPEPRLTPLQVEKTVFPRKAFGYDRRAVEAFRREVVKEMERLIQRARQLEQAERELTTEVSRFRDLEATLRDAVLLGQRAADEARAAAHREAEAILAEARAVARQIRHDAEIQVQQLQADLVRLSGERDSLIAALRSFVEGLTARLELSASTAAVNMSAQQEVSDGALASGDAESEP